MIIDEFNQEWPGPLAFRKLNQRESARASIVSDVEINALIRYIDKNLHIYAPGSPYRGNAR
jgi:hypothetical protein